MPIQNSQGRPRPQVPAPMSCQQECRHPSGRKHAPRAATPAQAALVPGAPRKRFLQPFAARSCGAITTAVRCPAAGTRRSSTCITFERVPKAETYVRQSAFGQRYRRDGSCARGATNARIGRALSARGTSRSARPRGYGKERNRLDRSRPSRGSGPQRARVVDAEQLGEGVVASRPRRSLDSCCI
jgi:hypothetical protein